MNMASSDQQESVVFYGRKPGNHHRISERVPVGGTSTKRFEKIERMEILPIWKGESSPSK